MECKACGVWFVSGDKSGVCHTCKRTLKKMGLDLPYERLRELVEADREGRCVVMLCKPGETVYQADTERVYELKVRKIIYDCGHIAFDDRAIGKTVFLTRESADSALKGEQDG